MHCLIVKRIYSVLLFPLILFAVLGCQSTYYKTMEKFGYHKRDILVDRVQEARDTQEEAKEQFKTALEEFSSVVNFSGGDLEAKYDTLNTEYEKSDKKASSVRDRIKSVESVAEALFQEWEVELEQYTSKRLRQSSEEKLAQTRVQYEQLIGAMKRAERKIDPVLAAFRDQILFMKHNLNAQAIASLQGELAFIEEEVASLIEEMEASISEADAFIHAMGETSTS